MVKTCNVVILPSKSGVVLPNSLARHSQTKELIYNTFDAQFISNALVGQHLYLVCDDHICIGDWVISDKSVGKVIHIFNTVCELDLGWTTTQTRTLSDCQKIIASTDSSMSYPFARSVLVA